MIASENVRLSPSSPSLESYFDAFAPAPAWDALLAWPPDVFALANLVLDHTESYRFVVAPPYGRRWPPLADWDGQVRTAAAAWKESAGAVSGSVFPSFVHALWDTVTRARDLPLSLVRSGEEWDLTTALLTLHAIADEACAGLSTTGAAAATDSFDGLAWRMLQEHGSLSRISPSRVRIVPKTHFSARGITIRSLSRYLALCYESVDVRWRSGEPRPAGRREYNIVLLPWPLSIKSSDFRPAEPEAVENMDSALFGFFEFVPAARFECETAASVLATARETAGHVDAVILPEASLAADAVAELERALDDNGASFLVAGVREPPTEAMFGRNYLHFGIKTASGWTRYEQDKHHRWCLDEPQIRQYHLTRSLRPEKRWWEAIDIRERALHIIDVGDGITTAPLVCEDLARLDEVADLVRRIGPTLVIAVLLDGPQLASRWPCRYASVLADDPGSTVLTLTSFGMAVRSRPARHPRSRVIAHWNNRRDGIHEIELDPRAAGVLLRATVDAAPAWTADGRLHHSVPLLELHSVQQLHARERGRRQTRREVRVVV